MLILYVPKVKQTIVIHVHYGNFTVVIILSHFYAYITEQVHVKRAIIENTGQLRLSFTIFL